MFKIFSKEGCSLCDQAETILKDNDLAYEKRTVSKEELKELCGGSFDAYPQIFLGSKRIGNFFEFEEFLADEFEPMLYPTLARFTVFPLKHPRLWELYKTAQMANWTAEEIDFSRDMADWLKLSDGEKRFIKYVLAFFAGSDGIVFENVMSNFADEVQWPEARSFYAYQCHNEMVHGETYSLLIDKYIDSESEKCELFNAIETIPCIRQKADWALKWFDASRPFGERLFAFACVEGIFFSGSFCAIFWLKKRGLLPGLCFSNELISRDEGMHQQFAVELFGMLKHAPNHATLRGIVAEAVQIEKSFIIDALPCALIGMNAKSMGEYIEFVADRLLKQVGAEPLFKTANPFAFMEAISLPGKTNFFEKRVSDYQKMDDTVHDLTFDDDF